MNNNSEYDIALMILRQEFRDDSNELLTKLSDLQNSINILIEILQVQKQQNTVKPYVSSEGLMWIKTYYDSVCKVYDKRNTHGLEYKTLVRAKKLLEQSGDDNE